MSPIWQWRSWVLVLLLVGPVLAYVGLGMLWLWERGWVVCTVAAVLWLVAGGVFSVLAARWTKDGPPDHAAPGLGLAPDLLAAGPRCVEARPGRGRSRRDADLRGSARGRHLHRDGPATLAGAWPPTIIPSRPTRSTTCRWSSS